MIKYTKIETELLKEPLQIYYHLKNIGISENYVSLLRKNMENILVNGVPSTIKASVCRQDELLINVNPSTSTSVKPIDKPLDIVFEDESVLLVNKPAGISTMANRSHYDNNLAGRIVFHCQKKQPDFTLRIVNRLDKDTQGLVLIAKNLYVYKTLLESSKKKYHAMLVGKIDKKLEIHSPILDVVENGRINLKRIVDPSGKQASTFIKPIKSFENHTLCEIEIVFGRTHQIRVHSSSVNHPIEGDYIYHNPSDLISHTALICKEMSFFHPILKQQLSFSVDYGKSFKALLEKI